MHRGDCLGVQAVMCPTPATRAVTIDMWAEATIG